MDKRVIEQTIAEIRHELEKANISIDALKRYGVVVMPVVDEEDHIQFGTWSEDDDNES